MPLIYFKTENDIYTTQVQQLHNTLSHGGVVKLLYLCSVGINPHTGAAQQPLVVVVGNY